mgnify:CR=1 FL=1
MRRTRADKVCVHGRAQAGLILLALLLMLAFGIKDLLVGQFAKGKIQFFKNEAGSGLPKFRKGELLLTGTKPAEVPGVW